MTCLFLCPLLYIYKTIKELFSLDNNSPTEQTLSALVAVMDLDLAEIYPIHVPHWQR